MHATVRSCPNGLHKNPFCTRCIFDIFSLVYRPDLVFINATFFCGALGKFFWVNELLMVLFWLFLFYFLGFMKVFSLGPLDKSIKTSTTNTSVISFWLTLINCVGLCHAYSIVDALLLLLLPATKANFEKMPNGNNEAQALRLGPVHECNCQWQRHSVWVRLQSHAYSCPFHVPSTIHILSSTSLLLLPATAAGCQRNAARHNACTMGSIILWLSVSVCVCVICSVAQSCLRILNAHNDDYDFHIRDHDDDNDVDANLTNQKFNNRCFWPTQQ